MIECENERAAPASRVPPMRHRASLAWASLCAFGFAVSLLAACGGRYEVIRDDDDHSGGAASAGRAGSTSSRAGTSAGGAPNSASAGANSAGSSSGRCAGFTCIVPDCAEGSTLQVLDGLCCPTCTACPPCPKRSCPAGTQSEKLPGACCPSCVDNDGGACQMGKQTYSALRTEMMRKYASGCASSSECKTVEAVNACEQGCSYMTVWYGNADSLVTNLSSAASMLCSSCKPGPVPPCTPPPEPFCFNSRCTF